MKEGIEPPQTPIDIFKGLEIALLKQPNIDQILNAFKYQSNYFKIPVQEPLI